MQLIRAPPNSHLQNKVEEVNNLKISFKPAAVLTISIVAFFIALIAFVWSTTTAILDEEVPRSLAVSAPAIVYPSSAIEVDTTDIANGRITVAYSGTSDRRIKILISKEDGEIYQYDVVDKINCYPFTEGDGTYQIAIYQNVIGNRYRLLQRQTVPVSLENPYTPFLLPHQRVAYTEDTRCIWTAQQLCDGMAITDKLDVLYRYVADRCSYDYQKAAQVPSGYVTDLDAVWETSSGICVDYAATLVAMLRSQDIPAKLIYGYAGEGYHAWVSAYHNSAWVILDPTYLSTGGSTAKEFIQISSNYTPVYQY